MPAIFKNGKEYVTTTNAASISVGIGQNINLNLQTTVQNSLSNFAQIEYSPSQHSYIEGDLLVLNGVLYRAISNISIGNNLLIGSNIERVTVQNAIQKQLSFVGMIVMSTTLDSELEVQKIYGSDTSWIQHSGYMLRGASQGVTGGLNNKHSDGGAETVTLTTQQMPVHTHIQNSHNHTQNSHNHTQNSHNHTQNSHNHTQNKHNHTQNKHFHSVPAHKHNIPDHTHTATVKHNGVYPMGGASGAFAGYVIYTSGTSKTDLITISTKSGLTTADKAAFNSSETTATNQDATATNQATTATNQATTATNQATTATNQATTATNQNAGGGQSHNNMPPYKNVYIWQRVA